MNCRLSSLNILIYVIYSLVFQYRMAFLRYFNKFFCNNVSLNITNDILAEQKQQFHMDANFYLNFRWSTHNSAATLGKFADMKNTMQTVINDYRLIFS